MMAMHDASGGTIGFVKIFRDQTEARLAEEARRRAEERFRILVESVEDYAIFLLDAEGFITTWNQGAQRIKGYTEAEVLGQHVSIFYPPEALAAGLPEREMKTAREVGRSEDESWRVRRSGERFWVNEIMIPLPGPSETGFAKISRDLTAAREAQQALEQSRADLWEALQENERAREQAEAAVRAKDHFLAVLSHELRTPLTPVLMAVQTLARRKDLPEPVVDALEMIRRNVKIEAQFIDDMLDVTRIERGKLELVCQPMDLHQALRHALEVADPDIQEKKQTLTVSLEATQHELVGDFTRLQQAFWNLLKNASKFTPEGGPIRVSSRNEDGCVCIEVCDGGIGFEPGAEERIFNPFVQADSSVTQKFGGLGLGLAITKATIDGHGGKLTASSKGPDRGATFIVALPLGALKET
jgi:PAS domain S-box-containing protein